MFNTKHLDKVLGEIRNLNKKNYFCPKKNLLAYRLSKMSRNYRGVTMERMIRDYYISKRFNVKYMGGTNPFDMLVNGKKIEVKSALASVKIVRGKKKYTYKFQHICTKNFHKLVLVFISPEGISTRTMDSRTVSKYLTGKKKHKELYVGQRIFGKVLVA